jgi:hypothetical protein
MNPGVYACRYMAVCIYLRYAAVTAIVAMFMGEITSPLQNVWFVLKTLRYDSQLADDLFRHVSWTYALCYVLCRSILGPIMVRPTTF